MSVILDSVKAGKVIRSANFLVFDFDGVLADSVEVKTSAFAALYKSYGDIVEQKVIKHHRENGGMSRFDKFKYYHNEFLGEEISEYEISELSNSFSKLVVDNVVSSPEISGAGHFLEKYCTKDKRCFVNSATPTNEVSEIVTRRGLSRYFEAVYGSPSNKTENLLKIIDTYKLDVKKGLFFGDAVSDFNAAVNVQINFIGIGELLTNILHTDKRNWMVFKDFDEYLNGN